MMIDEKNTAEQGVEKKYRPYLIIAFLTVGFSFVAPWVLTLPYGYLAINQHTALIGDTLGGMMNPFIALAGVILTFLAFYVQYAANRDQRNDFDKQLRENKTQFQSEMKAQSVQYTRTQFEHQFYEMLRLHKENVNEVSLTLNDFIRVDDKFELHKVDLKGRAVFMYFIEELSVIYSAVKQECKHEPIDFIINKAYNLFFHGLTNTVELPLTEDLSPFDRSKVKYVNSLNLFRNSVRDNPNIHIKNVVKSSFSYVLKEDLNYNLFQGHYSVLAHYYRHLYQTVKYVVNQKNTSVSYLEKRNYLRILRAQLSSQEQALLFYNWKSGFGDGWENSKNKFFTDYRMIHNLYDDILLDDFNLSDIFDLEATSMRSEKESDSLFEFQDWK